MAVGGGAPEFFGGVDLGDGAVAHDGDAVADGEGFVLVVGDEDGGGVGGAQDGAEVGGESFAEFFVEGGEGFVEEEECGVWGEGSGEGDALAFASGHGGDVAGVVAGESDEGEEFVDSGVALLAGGAGCAGGVGGEAVGDVGGDVFVGEELAVLEHEAEVAFVDGHGVHGGVVVGDAPVGGVFESGDGA